MDRTISRLSKDVTVLQSYTDQNFFNSTETLNAEDELIIPDIKIINNQIGSFNYSGKFNNSQFNGTYNEPDSYDPLIDILIFTDSDESLAFGGEIDSVQSGGISSIPKEEDDDIFVLPRQPVLDDLFYGIQAEQSKMTTDFFLKSTLNRIFIQDMTSSSIWQPI